MHGLSRRSFMAASGGVVWAAAAPHFTWGWASPLEPEVSGAEPWYAQAWRRAVIDMHIPDWDPAFLAQFDPKQYAKMLVRSRA